MNRFCAALTATLLTFTGAAASAAPIVIDFESYGVGDVITANTDLGGVTLDQDIRIHGLNQFPPDATGNVALTVDPFADDFSGEFVNQVSSFSVAVGDECCDIDTVTLSVYDAFMVLLGTDSYSAASGQVLSVAAAGIKFFSVDQSGLVVFDNLTFEVEEVEAVPEPASLLLLGAGLAAIGARVRSARRR